MDGYNISPRLLEHIRDTIPEGSTILELGSGAGTAELLKFYTVYSVEHNLKWVGRYGSNYIHAELERHKPLGGHLLPDDGRDSSLWYNRENLRKGLDGLEYSLLLIDGPNNPYRAGVVRYLDMFNTDCHIILDDTHRRLEREIIYRISEKVGRSYTVYSACGGDKSFAFINKPHPASS